MKLNEIRSNFLKYFEKNDHKIVPSVPLVNKNDPTLLFVNAGMNPFKDIFTGDKKAEYPRVANSQKCLRVSGKHNDLEEVGYDTYHLTFFEMLGNWSFGDYFKEKAIELAWNFITKELQIPEDRLFATYYNGEGVPNTEQDTETQKIWTKYLPEDKILGFSSKDNFWEMGETGPCGPCTEIHIDLRPDEERKKIPAQEVINKGHNLVIELWNLVFIQYQKKADGSIVPLKMKSVDTGMGLERLAMVMQNKTSLYDIDVFTTIKNALIENEGLKQPESEKEIIATRVILDHSRAITFAIADGAMPSNTGAGYVIRRILRRALRYAYQFLNIKEPFLFKLVDTIAEIYKDIYPEVLQQKETLKNIIRQEEKTFLRTLGKGIKLFYEFIEDNKNIKTIPGEFVFKLYDTYGFPRDLTRILAEELNLKIDEEGFEEELKKQKERSKKATTTKQGDWIVLNEGEPKFVGYDTLQTETEILRYRKVQRKNKTFYQLVLKETPFYPEGGGQVGDVGKLTQGDKTIKIIDTQKENDLIIHFAKEIPGDLSGKWLAEVDKRHRRETMAHHSATHLLHAALRKVLGEHVGQKGSFVGPEYLRFDFSHSTKVSEEELQKIENIVNEKIAEAIPLTELRDVPLEEAKKMGALAFFGEKYGEKVRVISFGRDFSTELCGGTHVPNTIFIRLFKITSERAIAGGVRRIEAKAATSALKYLNEKENELTEIAKLVQATKKPSQKVKKILEENKKLQETIEKLQNKQLQAIKSEMLRELSQNQSISYAKVLEGLDKNALHKLAFELRKQAQNSIILLISKNEGKVLMYLFFSEDIKPEGELNAAKLLRELAKIVKGGGGGQPFLASAGGKDASKIPELIQEFHKKIKEINAGTRASKEN